MNFKIDTREKFTMITPESDFSSDNLTAEFKKLIKSYLQHKTNIVINLKNVINVEENIVNDLAALQSEFYEQNVSFVLCEVQPSFKTIMEQLDLDDALNVTLTDTEAWDIVQMEEIERELFNDDNE